VKDFFASSSALVRFDGLWDLRGDEDGDCEPLSWMNLSFRGDLRIFFGEYCSFQSLTVSAFQKASKLCRSGGVGIRVRVFEGDCNRDFDGDCGGVMGLSIVLVLGIECSRGGEKRRNAPVFSLSDELAGRE
jgi:hypothetical protein